MSLREAVMTQFFLLIIKVFLISTEIRNVVFMFSELLGLIFQELLLFLYLVDGLIVAASVR